MNQKAYIFKQTPIHLLSLCVPLFLKYKQWQYSYLFFLVIFSFAYVSTFEFKVALSDHIINIRLSFLFN